MSTNIFLVTITLDQLRRNPYEFSQQLSQFTNARNTTIVFSIFVIGLQCHLVGIMWNHKVKGFNLTKSLRLRRWLKLEEKNFIKDLLEYHKYWYHNIFILL